MTLIQPLSDSILTNCVKPAFNAWRNGELATLNDFEEEAKGRIEWFMNSSSMQTAIQEQVEPWSEEVIHGIEMDICEISRKHHVEFSISHGALNIQANGGKQNGLTINFLNVIHTVVSIVLMVVSGIVCGGSGLALLTAGILGVVLGALLALVFAVMGKKLAVRLLMKMNIPVLMRRMISENSIVSSQNRQKISAGICQGMLEDQTMVDDLVKQVSGCIETAISDATGDVERAMVA